MSLRGRLTLLYVSIVGGILLLFGLAVYISVSQTIKEQLDDALRRAARQVYASTDFKADGQVQVVGLMTMRLLVRLDDHASTCRELTKGRAGRPPYLSFIHL